MPGEKRGGKGGKKKWSKAKAKEKLQNAVFFDKERYDKMVQEVPKMKLITIAAVSEKMKLSGYAFFVLLVVGREQKMTINNNNNNNH